MPLDPSHSWTTGCRQWWKPMVTAKGNSEKCDTCPTVLIRTVLSFSHDLKTEWHNPAVTHRLNPIAMGDGSHIHTHSTGIAGHFSLQSLSPATIRQLNTLQFTDTITRHGYYGQWHISQFSLNKAGFGNSTSCCQNCGWGHWVCSITLIWLQIPMVERTTLEYHSNNQVLVMQHNAVLLFYPLWSFSNKYSPLARWPPVARGNGHAGYHWKIPNEQM